MLVNFVKAGKYYIKPSQYFTPVHKYTSVDTLQHRCLLIVATIVYCSAVYCSVCKVNAVILILM